MKLGDLTEKMQTLFWFFNGMIFAGNHATFRKQSKQRRENGEFSRNFGKPRIVTLSNADVLFFGIQRISGKPSGLQEIRQSGEKRSTFLEPSTYEN